MKIRINFRKVVSFCLISLLTIQCFALGTTETSFAEDVKDSYIVIDTAGNAQAVNLSEREASSMKTDSEIACVEKDFIIESEAYEEWDMMKPASENWSLEAINVENAAASGKVKIAILDSGVDITDNIDIAERKNFISDKPVETPLFEDLCGHGTSVASVIMGKGTDSEVKGVNSNVELYSARVLDENKQAPISRVVEAIYWAIEKDVDIINISFGTQTYSEALKTAIDAAAEKGILIVAAAGNHGSSSVDYPAAFENVLSVGSVNAAGELSDFSSSGEKVDVAAPGEAVLAQGNFGEDLVMSGTSLAAPHVTGVASLLWSKDLSKPASFIRTLIKLSAKEMTGTAYGLVDYDYALQIYDETAQQFDAVAEGEKPEGNTEENKPEEETVPMPEEPSTPSAEEEKAESGDPQELEESSDLESQTEADTAATLEQNDEESLPAAEEVKEEAQASEEVNTQVIREETTDPTLEETEKTESAVPEIKLPDIESAEFEEIVLERLEVSENTAAAVDLSDPVVDGSWKAAVHQSVITNAAMKSGAIYADSESHPFMKGMTKHPEFHGYSWHNNPSTTTFNTGTCNYVANYNYMVKLAQSYARGNGYMDVPLAPGQDSACRTAIRAAMQDLLDYEEKLPSAQRKFWGKDDLVQKNFVMGLAAHTALDACAHSTFETKSTAVGSTAAWTRITHAESERGIPKADDPDYLPQRERMAAEMMKNIIRRAASVTKTSNVGNASDDFYPGEVFLNKNLKFRMTKIKTFAQNAGMTSYKATALGKLTSTIVT